MDALLTHLAPIIINFSCQLSRKNRSIDTSNANFEHLQWLVKSTLIIFSYKWKDLFGLRKFLPRSPAKLRNFAIVSV